MSLIFRLYIGIALFGLLVISCKKEKITKWEVIDSGTTSDLNSVFFVDKYIGYACGGERFSDNKIIKTIDGGNTWFNIDPDVIQPEKKALYSIFFLNKDSGYATGFDGKIFHTVNGGTTWTLQQGYWTPFRSVKFLDANTGYLAGGVGYGDGIIYKTENGGETWSQTQFQQELRDIYFIDINTGFAAGNGVFLKTIDRGKKWTDLNFISDFYQSIAFSDSFNGVVVGYAGSIIRTSDGGHSWDIVRNGNNLLQEAWKFNAVAFRNNIGYIAGDNGVLLKSKDNGKSWNRINSPYNDDFRQIAFVDDNHLVIVCPGGKIYKLTD